MRAGQNRQSNNNTNTPSNKQSLNKPDCRATITSTTSTTTITRPPQNQSRPSCHRKRKRSPLSGRIGAHLLLERSNKFSNNCLCKSNLFILFSPQVGLHNTRRASASFPNKPILSSNCLPLISLKILERPAELMGPNAATNEPAKVALELPKKPAAISQSRRGFHFLPAALPLCFARRKAT